MLSAHELAVVTMGKTHDYAPRLSKKTCGAACCNPTNQFEGPHPRLDLTHFKGQRRISCPVKPSRGFLSLIRHSSAGPCVAMMLGSIVGEDLCCSFRVVAYKCTRKRYGPRQVSGDPNSMHRRRTSMSEPVAKKKIDRS